MGEQDSLAGGKLYSNGGDQIDDNEVCDIDKLLVVTFTNAAAAEMREKIGVALMKRISEEPGNVRLRRQLSFLSSARIQTVHAFCLDLVKEHFALCGVPADFGMADDGVAAELRQQALDDALEELYGEGDEDFRCLCSALAEEKGDAALASVIEDIYDKLTSHVDPMGDLERFTSEEGQGRWKESLMSYAFRSLKGAAERLERAEEMFETVEEVYSKYHPAFEYCLDFAQNACESMERGDWDGTYNIIAAFKNPSFKSVRGDEYKIFTEPAKKAKEDFKNAVDKLKKSVFVADEKSLAFADEINLSALKGLRLAVRRYSDKYTEYKLGRKLLDFSDLEHMALALLMDENGQPTPLGEEISEGIYELLVDEYQDTNDIQEAIFRVVSSKARSSFFVGDVKQSIYRFRMAKPEIFSDRYDGSIDFEDGARNVDMRLPLNRNFRSRREILEVCNHIFSAVMSRAFGEIDYTEDEALHPAAPYQGEGQVRLAVIDMQGASDDEDSPEKAEAEAVYVANAIADMVGQETVSDPFAGTSRPARYSDFAILLSSFTNKSPYFIRELDRLGIPIKGGQKDFWNSMELLAITSFLRVLDNRRQDVPLIGLMRSPFFRFTPDELAEIRLEDRDAEFFDAAVLHAKRGDKKTAEFLRVIDRYVSYVANTPPAQLLGMIYSEMSAIALFTAVKGEAAGANLRAFYNMALEYEGSGHRSLYDFIRYFESRMEQGSAPEIEEGEGVRIMSIHKSKGLEFPIVFLPDLNKSFNLDDARSRVIMHDRLGIGIKLRISQSRIEYRTPMHRAAAVAVREELAGEEVRKLYVAMTRAREKLVLVMGLKNAGKTMEEIGLDMRLGGITPTWLSERGNWGSWILAALTQKECPYITTDVIPYASIERRRRGQRAEVEEPRGQVRDDLLAMLARSGEEYAYADMSALPSKLTPAGARRLLEDSGVIDSHEGKSFVEIYRRALDDDGTLTAARRGSAVHLVLSQIDPESWGDTAAIAKKIDEMVAKGQLSEAEGRSVDPAKISAFGLSAWGSGLGEKRVIREYEFSVLMTPFELGLGPRQDEDILINGVIDLMLMDKEGITLIDFKTDNVKAGREPEGALRHKLQLDIYALAAEKVFERPVREKVVFFLRTGVGVRL